MKKLLSVVLVMALVITSVVFMPQSAYAKGKVKSIKVSKTKMTLQVGKSDSAKVTVKVKKKASKAFKVKTSNANVATAKKSGKKVVVTGVGAGSAKITVTSKANKKKKKVIKVTVTKPAPKPEDVVTLSIKQLEGNTFKLDFSKAVKITSKNIKVQTKVYADGKYNKEVLVYDVSTRDSKSYYVAMCDGINDANIVKFTVSGVNKKDIVKEITASDPDTHYNTTYEFAYALKTGEHFEEVYDLSYYFVPKGNPAIKVNNLPNGLSSEIKGSEIVIKGAPTTVGVQKASITCEDEKGCTDTLKVTFVIGSDDSIQTYSMDETCYVTSDGSDYYQGDQKFYIAGGSGSYSLSVTSYPGVAYGEPYDCGSGEYRWTYRAYYPGDYDGKILVTDDNDSSKTAKINTLIEAKKGVTVTGTVKTKTGKPVPGANVWATKNEEVKGDNWLYYGMGTDENGGYTLYLPKANVNLTAEFNGAYDYEINKEITENCVSNFTLDLCEIQLTTDDPELNFKDIGYWYNDNGDEFACNGNILFLKKGKQNIVSQPTSNAKEASFNIDLENDTSVKVSVKTYTLTLGDNIANFKNTNNRYFKFVPETDDEYNFYFDLEWYYCYRSIYLYDSDGNVITSTGSNYGGCDISYNLEAGKTYYLGFYSEERNLKGSIYVQKITY